MSSGQGELPNLVLEHLRLMRAETSAHQAETKTQYDQMRAETNARFDKIDGEIAGLKATIRGYERDTIVEI